MKPDRDAVADLMVVALARLVSAADVIGVGLGTPLALVAALVARVCQGDSVHVLAGGAVDVDGDVDTWMSGPRATLGRTPGYVSHFDSMDMAERQAMTLQFLRPAQVDAVGNLNTSRIGPLEAPAVRFPGGLATADVPSLLPRVIAYHPDHQKRSLPHRVDWVTGAGAGRPSRHHHSSGTVALVTDLAVVEFSEQAARVASIHPWTTRDQIQQNTGFDIEVRQDTPRTPWPDGNEVEALSAIDPNRRRNAEIRTGPTKAAEVQR